MRQLEAGFNRLRLQFLPSRGNFILVRVGDAIAVYGKLLEHGVIVRPVGNYELPHWLRITVGLPRENERFLSALETALHA